MDVMPKAGQEERFLTTTDWSGYLSIREALDHTRVRLTFDRGRLEFMTPSSKHEKIKKLLSSMLEFLLVEMETDFEFGGSMTFKREDLERGLEPDECYWIAHCLDVRGRDEFDPHSDPPPDLVLEVDISASSIDRMSAYALMGVREVWRWIDGRGLLFYGLEDTEYSAISESLAVAGLSSDVLVRFLEERKDRSAQEILRDFRDWVRVELKSD